VTATRETIEADLCVVGAGIVGLALAHEARRRGLSVVILERDGAAVGASVRNFGHVFVTGVADGDDLDCALRSRARWLELARIGGPPVLEAGTLVLARAEDELSVIEGVAANPDRKARVLSGDEIEGLAPIPTDTVVGGLRCELDVRVDPRAAAGTLARMLEDDDGANVRWGERVEDAEPGLVHAATVTVRAPRALFCPGPDHDTLPRTLRSGMPELTRCKLQMLRVAAPDGRRFTPVLMTGLSMVRYPAFTAQLGSAALLARLRAERGELIAAGIHLIVAQLPDGDLIIGDTHSYGDTPTPFAEARLDELLLDEARVLLGAAQLEVRERWIGLYPSASTGGHFAVWSPFAGSAIVEVISGLGMTMAFGRAAAVLDSLEPA